MVEVWEWHPLRDDEKTSTILVLLEESGRPMAMRNGPLFPVMVSGVLLTVLLAGCLGTPEDPDGGGEAPLRVEPWAVVSLVDTGTNPYHVDFRLEGPLGSVHPSEYIPGYPTDIETVEITLDAQDLESALEADKAVWQALEPRTPYWFKGTRVTGISFLDNPVDEDVGFVWSTGHGTMVASKAAGSGYSLCPTCHIVGVQGFNAAGVAWSAEQAWIDVQSNSWGPVPAFAWADHVLPGNDPELAGIMQEAASNQAVFVAAGNGIGGGLGVIGNPSPTDSTSGPPGVIAVGGHDNGQITLWTAWMVHIVADACRNWAAVGNSMDEYSPRGGGGTSGASPYAAGAAARMIQEARWILGSTTPRDLDTGVLAEAPEGHPVPASGPLSDGVFTLDELKQVLFRTASPVPQYDRASGEQCPITSPAFTVPVEWSILPEEVPTWPWLGYGSIDTFSLERGLGVLNGTIELPQRDQEDQFYELDQQLREAYHSVP